MSSAQRIEVTLWELVDLTRRSRRSILLRVYLERIGHFYEAHPELTGPTR